MNNLEDIFKENDFPVNRLIGSFQVADKNKFSRFSDPIIYETVRSIKDLFTMIRNRFPFYDYLSLQIVVKISGIKEAIKLMDKYVSEVEDEPIQHIISKPEFLTEEHKPSDGTWKLQLTFDMDTMSTKECSIVTQNLTYIFDLPPGSILVENIKNDGSVILIYEISQKVKEYLINLTFSACELKTLALLKINCFVIDDEVELKVFSNCNTEVTI